MGRTTKALADDLAAELKLPTRTARHFVQHLLEMTEDDLVTTGGIRRRRRCPGIPGRPDPPPLRVDLPRLEDRPCWRERVPRWTPDGGGVMKTCPRLLAVAVLALLALASSGWRVLAGPAPRMAILVVGDAGNRDVDAMAGALRKKFRAFRDAGTFKGVPGLVDNLETYDFSVGSQRIFCTNRLGISGPGLPVVCLVEINPAGFPVRVLRKVRVLQVDQGVAAVCGWLGLGQASATGQVRRVSPVQVEMLRVPGGTFIVGSLEGHADERPPHLVTVGSFEIGKYEVTNAQFRAFVKASGYGESRDWEQWAALWGESAPVVSVGPSGARAFCKWAGLRLPTEVEWEWAARGPEGRKYPWGNEWDPERAVCDANSGNRPQPVGSRPSGVSWCGAMDLAGNVAEWCSSKHRPYPYRGSDGREDLSGNEARVDRGGTWWSDHDGCRATYRLSYLPACSRFRAYGDRYHTVGFRCARSEP